MSQLGKFDKQPREVEFYAIQFAQDMSDTDDIIGGYAAISIKGFTEVDLTAPYTATAADTNKLFYTGFNITLPTGVSDGYVISVSNTDQDSAVLVGSITIPARGATVIRRQGGQWVSEISAITIVVNLTSDKRIRVSISGGINKTTYKCQLTAQTSEGRVLEDEFALRIKEE